MLTHWISQEKFYQYAQHLFIDPLVIRKIYRTDTNKYRLQVFCFVCWQLLTLSANCNTPYDDGLRYTIRSVVQYPTLGNLSPNKFHVPQSGLAYTGLDRTALYWMIWYLLPLSLCLFPCPLGEHLNLIHIWGHMSAYLAKDMDHVYSHSGLAVMCIATLVIACTESYKHTP